MRGSPSRSSDPGGSFAPFSDQYYERVLTLTSLPSSLLLTILPPFLYASEVFLLCRVRFSCVHPPQIIPCDAPNHSIDGFLLAIFFLNRWALSALLACARGSRLSFFFYLLLPSLLFSTIPNSVILLRYFLFPSCSPAPMRRAASLSTLSSFVSAVPPWKHVQDHPLYRGEASYMKETTLTTKRLHFSFSS